MILWIQIPKFLEYRLKRTQTYTGRFSNALVKGVHLKALNVESQIYIISFFPRKLLSVVSFQKLNFCIS